MTAPACIKRGCNEDFVGHHHTCPVASYIDPRTCPPCSFAPDPISVDK